MAILLPPSREAGEDRYQPLAEINVTPMVDVMLVLRIIFMATAPSSPGAPPLALSQPRRAAAAHGRIAVPRSGAAAARRNRAAAPRPAPAPGGHPEAAAAAPSAKAHCP